MTTVVQRLGCWLAIVGGDVGVGGQWSRGGDGTVKGAGVGDSDGAGQEPGRAMAETLSEQTGNRLGAVVG